MQANDQHKAWGLYKQDILQHGRQQETVSNMVNSLTPSVTGSSGQLHFPMRGLFSYRKSPYSLPRLGLSGFPYVVCFRGCQVQRQAHRTCWTALKIVQYRSGRRR